MAVPETSCVEKQSKHTSECLQKELKLNESEFTVCLSRDPTGLSARCLVHRTWLETVSSCGKIFSSFLRISLEERNAIFSQTVKIEAPLQWVYVSVIPKDATVLPGCVGPVPNHDVDDNSKRSLLGYVDQLAALERRRIWRQFDHFRSHLNDRKETQPVTAAFVSDFVRHMYGVELMKLVPCDPPSSFDTTSTTSRIMPCLCHPNILPLFAALEGQDAFYLLQPYIEHTLHDLIFFTPAVLVNSSVKQQFLVYQLLQGLAEVHSHGIPQNYLDMSSILVDEKLWIKLPPPSLFISESMKESVKKVPHLSDSFVETKSKDDVLNNSAQTDLLKYTKQWLLGGISNFDYLMLLNHAAGREVGNFNHHAVMPWIMDFSVPYGGWRDFTKSKYRLNKGDSQLDFTYEVTRMGSSDASVGLGVLPPHHISDLLSDLTCYVYLARQTQKDVLCAHVRPLWVPNEYPRSIQRIQIWTPDECIPQFFIDPSVFSSIHPDLPDLEVPSWADSPEDFVHQHMAALESSHVSENLHHWIDIAFGYKLSGTAALKAKNIVLSLVNPQEKPKNCGAVQLFTTPHPKRKAFLKSLSLILSAEKGLAHSVFVPVKSNRCMFVDSDSVVKIRKFEEQMKAESSKLSHKNSDSHGVEQMSPKEADTPEFVVEYPAPVLLDSLASRTSPERGTTETVNSSKSVEVTATTDTSDSRSKLSAFWKQKSGTAPPAKQSLVNYGEHLIELQEDYNPLVLMEELKSLAKFGISFLDRQKGIEQVLVEGSDITQHCGLDDHIHNDLLSVATLIIEVLCSQKIGVIFQQSDLASKRSIYMKLLQTREIQLPGFALAFVEKVFAVCLDENGYFRRVDSCLALAPPRLLVSEFNEQLIFPQYFVSLYEFISFLVSNVEASEQSWTQNPVDIAQENLPKIFPMLDAEGVDLLLPYLCPLFELSDTRFTATLHLFGQISKRLGPHKTTGLFLKSISVVMDHPLNAAGHARLMFRPFIQQLISGFGLQVFLERFVSFLVNALVRTQESAVKDAGYTKVESEEISSNRRCEVVTLKSSVSFVEEVASRSSHQSSLTVADVQDGLLSTVDSCIHLEAGNTDDATDDAVDADGGYSREHLTTFSTQQSNENIDDTTQGDSKVDDLVETAVAWSSKVVNTTCEPLLDRSNVQPSELRTVDVTKVAMDTLEWLIQFIGPVLTSAHLVVPLLKSLTAIQPAGDHFVMKNSSILKVLMSIVDIFGKHIFLEQYVRFAAETVKACEKRMTAKMEASLSAVIVLMRQCIVQLPDSTLYSQMEMLSQQIFQRVISILSSPSLLFPSGSKIRLKICHELLDTLLAIGNQLGREDAHLVLTIPLQQFFSSFDRVIPATSPDSHSSIKAGIKYSINLRHEQLGIHEEPIIDSEIVHPHTEEHVAANVLSQLQDVFSPELAQTAYVPFCQLIGQINMRRMLYNADLIEQVSYRHIEQDQQKSTQRLHQPRQTTPSKDDAKKLHLVVVDATHKNPLQPGSSDDDSEEEEEDLKHMKFGPTSWFVHLGNDVTPISTATSLQANEAGIAELSPGSLTGQLLNQLEAARTDFNQKVGSGSSDRGSISNTEGITQERSTKSVPMQHLEGNWLQHWKNQLGFIVQSPFSCDQLKLQAYSGHAGCIRSLCVVEGCGIFLSGSRDRTVRLWNLRSQGNGSAEVKSQLTYRRHQKTVFAVEYLERTSSVISCSGSIHIWNPDTSQCLKRLVSTGGSASAMSCLPPPHSTAVVATVAGSLRFVDVRIGSLMHDWRISSAGIPKSTCVDQAGHYVLVGLSSGVVTLLDVRTGLSVKTWKPHDAEIVKIRAIADRFVVASQDGRLSMWKSSNGSLVSFLKGHTEGVFDCQLFRDDVISVTSSKLGIHATHNRESTFTSHRIRPDIVKTSMSTLDLVPLSRELIVGTDTGQIYLLA